MGGSINLFIFCFSNKWVNVFKIVMGLGGGVGHTRKQDFKIKQEVQQKLKELNKTKPRIMT